MGRDAQMATVMSQVEREALAVRFPAHSRDRHPRQKTLLRLSELLPRQWRRQVVIQGQRFWLPG